MKKRGVGIAAGGHPAGMHGGGDTNQAQISLEMDGTFNLLMGTTDIGQGCKTAFSQVAAEELDVPIESITFVNTDTDIAPICTGAFASRAMFIGGNAAINACKDLKEKIKKFTAPMLGVEPDQLEVADNKVFVRGDPEKVKSMAEIGGAANFGGDFLVGTGAYMPEGGPEAEITDPETGAMPHVASIAYTSSIVELDVDTETGVVDLLKEIHVYEIGKAISPLMCKGQINGGAAMGISMALSEDAHPFWPSVEHAVDSFEDYPIATAADMAPDNQYAIIEVPHPDGPFGAKGFSESSTNVPIPAIIDAIHDAIGVWVTQFPATPEIILKALESKQASE